MLKEYSPIVIHTQEGSKLNKSSPDYKRTYREIREELIWRMGWEHRMDLTTLREQEFIPVGFSGTNKDAFDIMNHNPYYRIVKKRVDEYNNLTKEQKEREIRSRTISEIFAREQDLFVAQQEVALQAKPQVTETIFEPPIQIAA